jgi:hypothetical protein
MFRFRQVINDFAQLKGKGRQTVSAIVASGMAVKAAIEDCHAGIEISCSAADQK